MVSGAAERAALAALRDDLDWVRAHIATARESRARFAQELDGGGIRILAIHRELRLRSGARSAAEVAAHMRAAGVAVRPFAAVNGIGDGVRITVAPWPMMETALRALRDAVRT